MAFSPLAAAQDARNAAVDAPRGGFALGERPFAATSSWNTPIPSDAVFEKVGWPLGARFGIAWSSYSPAVHVTSASDPVVLVEHPATWGRPAGAVRVRIPAGADGASGTDGELLVIDGETVHNFWQFRRLGGGNATAQAYGATNVVTGNGWGLRSPFLGAGIVAAGSSQLAGLLVQAETDRGEITHALQIAIDGTLAKPGRIGEAIYGDGQNPDGLVQEGQRLAIPGTVAMPTGLSSLGQKVFRAYQTYGAFVIDVAGGTTNLRAQANAYDRWTIMALQRDLARISPLLQRVGRPVSENPPDETGG
ncbi:MAG TPA: hypothetical protein VGN82_13105 [Bosea sp. (in: a-proteobacteria)]|jgi:hypothetical protein|uniref:hypothetical protein n=1 Tax=Bosea sp. (in: a-proteobacteria) TaxID=1871050 RepID=UPI002E104541|nr:hypothetical protein [Bosea sp. (in: a-proteobacteria)]